MDGPFLYISPRFFLKLFCVFEAYGWPLFVFFTHNSWKNGVQTLETPKVEKFVKKRGISRSSDTRDSESRGICEKTGDFTGFRHSRFRKSRSRGFCGTTGDFTEFRESGFQKSVTPVRHSRSRKSRIFTFLKLMDGPFFVFEAYGWPLKNGKRAIHKLHFRVFEAYGWPLFRLG